MLYARDITNFTEFMKIVIATHNYDKLKELLNAFSNHLKDIEILTLNDFPDIGEIKEDGKLSFSVCEKINNYQLKQKLVILKSIKYLSQMVC